MSDIHDPDWVSEPDEQDRLADDLKKSGDEKIIDQFVNMMNRRSEFERELIMAYVRRAAHMGKLKLP